MDKPRRRFVMTLELGADSMDALRGDLRSILWSLDGIEERPWSSLSGGPATGHILKIEFDPAMTHESYHERLQAYLASLDEAKGEAGHG